MAAPEQTYPAHLDIDYPERLDRFTSFFRLIAIIPIAIVLSTLSASVNETVTTITGDNVITTTTRSGGGIAGGLFGATLLMIVFRRRYPRWWFDFAREWARFGTRVGAYALLLTDTYPSTVEHQTVHLDLAFIAFVSPQRAVLVDPGLVGVETAREAATLVMLAAVAVVAGGPLRRRVAAFFIAFAVWDLTYYVFLRVLDGWPASLATLDVYFLIPVTWVGPVATPVVASSVALVVASWTFLSRPRTRRAARAGRRARSRADATEVPR